MYRSYTETFWGEARQAPKLVWKWLEWKKDMRATSLQSCPALWDHMDCSLPGSSVHGISQARTLGRVASSRVPSRSRDRTYVSGVSCMAGGALYCAPWEAHSFVRAFFSCGLVKSCLLIPQGCVNIVLHHWLAVWSWESITISLSPQFCDNKKRDDKQGFGGFTGVRHRAMSVTPDLKCYSLGAILFLIFCKNSPGASRSTKTPNSNPQPNKTQFWRPPEGKQAVAPGF